MTGHASDYQEIMRLWDTYEASLDDHPCSHEDFVDCEVCGKGGDAKIAVGMRLHEVINLLQRYHQSLVSLARAVVQETELPRPAQLQQSLLASLTLLGPEETKSHPPAELNATACAQKYCNEFSINGWKKRDDVRDAIQQEYDNHPELTCERITELMVQARYHFLEIPQSERAFDWPAGAFLNESRWKYPERWTRSNVGEALSDRLRKKFFETGS